MEKGSRNLIILTIIMVVIWISLNVIQLTLAKHVFEGYQEAFRVKLDRAVVQIFNSLDLKAFDTFYHSESFEDWSRKNHMAVPMEHGSISVDSSFIFLRNVERIYEKTEYLFRFAQQTHSSLDYRLLDCDVMDSLITKHLHDYYIFDDCKTGYYSTQDNKFYCLSEGVDAKHLLEYGIKYPTVSINPEGKILSDSLYFYFPELYDRFHKDLVIAYILILLLSLILLYCFFTFVYIVQRQQKLNELRVQMLHNITHEIKTPITTISLACQFLQDKSVQKDEASSQEYLSMISEESKTILSMIDEVLTVVRAQKMPMKPMEDVRIHTLLKNVVDSTRLQLNQCHAVVNFDLQAENDLVLGCPSYLAHGFSNLVDNAIKYRNGDLVIDISTKMVDHTIEIQFKDNGIGIAKENQSLIFEPFSRINIENEHYIKGFGLGLNYFLQVINYHKGTIKVESELSKGTTFVVSLPLK